MVQHLTEDDVLNLSDCVRIALSNDEVPTMQDELNSMIDALDPLSRYREDAGAGQEASPGEKSADCEGLLREGGERR